MIDATTKKKLEARLKRIEGQVAGVRRMIDRDKYCVDVLLQVSAVEAALRGVSKIVLGQHIETCVAQAFKKGSKKARQTKIDEILKVFGRYGNVRSK